MASELVKNRRTVPVTATPMELAKKEQKGCC
jgi:hypothetical protein